MTATHETLVRPSSLSNATAAIFAMLGLIDVALAEGIDAAQAIRSAYPRTCVVVLSEYADESYAFELFRTARLAWLTCSRTASARWAACWKRSVRSASADR